MCENRDFSHFPARVARASARTPKILLEMNFPDKIRHFSYPKHENRSEMEKVIFNSSRNEISVWNEKYVNVIHYHKIKMEVDARVI